jgi:hypothetical protein
MGLLGRRALPPSHQLAGHGVGSDYPARNHFAQARLVRFSGGVCSKMDANSSKRWSKMDVEDLRASLDFGNTIADAASMLCRDEDEVRQKAKELGLVERPKRW